MKRKKTETTANKLPTSYDMLNEAIEQYVQNIEMPLTNSGANILVITDNNINEVTELYQKLKEALVCGQGMQLGI